MAAQPFSKIVLNSREELLSADLNRAQDLASANLQNILRDVGRGDDASVGGAFATAVGNPNFGATLVPMVNFTAGFSMTLSEGQAFFQDGSGTTLQSDTSDWVTLRWNSQTVTFTTPDATNPRIDLISVTPGSVNTDNQTRNILLDPTARTVAAQSVPKKQQPQGTVTVTAGTPAASPVAPATPGGAVAVLEVLVPAAAPTAATFKAARRQPRFAPFPVSTYHGIIQDCRLFWTTVNEATTGSVITSFNGGNTINKVVINGEVLAFGPLSTANGTIIQDAGGNNPFGAAAPANNDRPYYIYAAGGQGSPQASIGAGNVLYPVVVVESLVVPLFDGRPSAAITTPRGTTTNAILIGVGWTVKNSTRRKGCYTEGNWVHALSGQHTNGLAGDQFAGFNEVNSRSTAAGVTNHTLAAAPNLNVCGSARVMAQYENTVDGANILLGRNIGGTVHGKIQLFTDTAAGIGATGIFIQELSGAGASVDAGGDSDNATATLRMFATGYNIDLRRYGY